MKMKRFTLVLVAIAFLFAVAVYSSEMYNSSEQEEVDANKKLFSFEESQVQAFSVKTATQTLAFERDQDGTWQILSPQPGPADEASVAFLLNLLATETSDRVITVPAANASEFGLDQPQATVDVTLDNQEQHRLTLGGYNFNRSFLYAQIKAGSGPGSEPDIEDLKVLQVSPSLDQAVNRPLIEWQAKADDSPETDDPSTSSPIDPPVELPTTPTPSPQNQ